LGGKIILITFLCIVMLRGIELFLEWYKFFLEKRKIDSRQIVSLQRITLIILCILFWRALGIQKLTEEFSSDHFFFTMFIFSLYKFVISFFRNIKNKNL
jgi:hypothetical protein